MLVLFLLGKAVVRTPAARATVSRRALLTSGMVAGCTLPGAPTLAFADAEEDSAPPPPPGLQPLPSAFDFDVPFRGEPSAIKPFLGRASILVNVKFDDPISLDQMPALVERPRISLRNTAELHSITANMLTKNPNQMTACNSRTTGPCRRPKNSGRVHTPLRQ